MQVWPLLRAPASPPLSAGPPNSLQELPPHSIPWATTLGFTLSPVPPDRNPPGVTLEFETPTWNSEALSGLTQLASLPYLGPSFPHSLA